MSPTPGLPGQTLTARAAVASDRRFVPFPPAMTLPDQWVVQRAWWAALIGLCGVLLFPLLLVDIPPLLDYPNHLARAYVLASLPHDTVLAKFFAPHWSIIPNLGFDLLAPPLLQLLPVHVAGRVLVAVALLLPVLGAISYNTALGGRWWSLCAGFVAYNSCLLYGFLNFSISIGLALMLASAWLRWRENRPQAAIALAVVGAMALFFCHLMGLVFFGLLIGGAELFRLSQDRTLKAAMHRGLVLLLVIATPAALYVVSTLHELGGDAQFMPVGEKLQQLATTFVNYNWPLDLVTAGVAFGLPALCVILRRGIVPGPAAAATVLLLAGFLAAPYAWKGTFYLDTRLAIMLGFMPFAGFVPARWPAWFARAAITTLVVLFAARMALLTTAWAAHRTDIEDLRAVLEPVQPGQAIYFAETARREAPAYWLTNPQWRLLSNNLRTDEHMGALALIERRAYWPFEFDQPSQQPIKTLEPYKSLATRVGHLPNRAEAVAADLCGFDFVLLIEADALPNLPPERFRLVARSGFAALYSITRCEG